MTHPQDSPEHTPRFQRRPTYRDPWGVGFDLAHRYGYPLVALTPLEELEQRVARLEERIAQEDAIAAGLALLGQLHDEKAAA